MLAALACVDMVILFEEDNPLILIENIQPDVLVKGSEYTNNIVGAQVVIDRGGEVVLVPLLENISSTNIISKIRNIKDHDN
jgi:D-beta-D-heptose 7-phosphate kinase/D-beta-D-heptose 1-phosphate adenosyltransferase